MGTDREAKTGGHVCPWWFAYTFDNFLRRLVHKPATLLGPYVSEGMTVLDVGCGMGHFSIGMARLVGPGGKVHSVDLQQKMLDVTVARAARAGVGGRIQPHLCTARSLLFRVPVDFALLFWMAHEVPDPRHLFGEILEVLRPDGRLFIAEPSFHVTERQYASLVDAALQSGFLLLGKPPVRFSRTALLARDPSLPNAPDGRRRGRRPPQEAGTTSP